MNGCDYSLVEYAEDEQTDIIVFGGTPFPDEDQAPVDMGKDVSKIQDI